MSDICSHEEINAEKVILVATKADLLIPQYVKSDPNRRVPHDDQLGDFEDFTEWVRAKFDTDVFPEFGGKATDIYPVYHQTREEDGELEPNLEDNEVHAEGFEQVLKEIVLK